MKLRTWLIAPVALSLIAGCGGDNTESNPAPGGAGGSAGDAGVEAGGGAGQGGASGASGAGGATPQKDNRGDPAEFPTTCIETCQESCAKLETCGAEQSEAYPITLDECIERCAMGLTSPYGMWDDVTGNFRCCASQDECFDVATCGGWLKHPDPGPSCEKVCECISQYMTVPAAPTGVDAPEGYRFADDAVILEGTGSIPSLLQRGGVVVQGGRYTAVRFSQPIDAQTLKQLSPTRRPLPTFYDGAGRISAAVGDIFVKIDSEAALAKITKSAKTAGLSAPIAVRYGHNLYRIESSDAWQSVRALPSFNKLNGVRAELDMVRHYVKNYTPNDPKFPEQWHLENTGQLESLPGIDGRVAEAWDVTKGDPAVIIAINDDGVDVNHQDLAADCTAPLNFPTDWEQKLGDPVNGFGNHGTSVAGVAAAIGDNNEGGSGVCPGCKIMPHMVGEAVGPALNMTDQQVADGFALMVDEGAWVINNSWGIGGGDPNFEVTTFPIPLVPQVIKSAFTYAETTGRGGLGTVVVFAAGNENEIVTSYAGEPTTVAVAAVDDQGLKSYYSNYGPKVDVAAPSNGGLNGITTTSVEGEYTDSFGGTSSASPFTAGVVGLILSANPDLTAAEARDILRNSATVIDPVWGQWENGKSPIYGSGLVNAYVAVRMATGDCTDPATCQAPSDDCGTNCDKAACDVCRTNADCATGTVCQALPPLGASVCVAADGGAACPTGTKAYEGYCIPDRQTCNLCEATEACNGRDDNCDGEIDEGLTCVKRIVECPLAGEGCIATEVCAATACVTACDTDADCGQDYRCRAVKDRYGATDPAVKGCAAVGLAGCQPGCETLASSMTEAEIADFVSCMKDGATDCMSALSCSGKLPVTY